MPDHKYCYEYPRPAVTSDCVLFSRDGSGLRVLLIQRKIDPFKGKWAFPGGFMQMDETAGQCALRELEEETGIRDVSLQQLNTFSGIDRDPRGRTVSVVFYGFIDSSAHDMAAGDDAAGADWFSIDNIPPLAFDHDEILKMALERVGVF